MYLTHFEGNNMGSSICKQMYDENRPYTSCYGRPLLQAWLLPDLNTIPNNCIRENSLELSGYGIGFSSESPWFESRPDLTFLSCIRSFVSLLRTLFVRITSQIVTLVICPKNQG